MSLSDSPRETLDAARGASSSPGFAPPAGRSPSTTTIGKRARISHSRLLHSSPGIWARGEGATDYFALLRAESEAEQRLQRFGIRP